MNKLINLKKVGNGSQGCLSFFESNKDIPFEIKRIYYIYDVSVDTKRGMHAHKTLNQALWCPHGKIEIVLDNGNCTKSFILDSPEKVLLVGKGIWRDMFWRAEGSVLCVAASDYYSEQDYIRDYDDYLKYVKGGYWQNENKL